MSISIKGKNQERRVAAATETLAPGRLRAIVRASEIGLTIVAAVVGVVAGLAVTGMSLAAQMMHELIFGLQPDERLSGVAALAPHLAFAPVVGGAIMGALLLGLRFLPPAVDPIEANALHGGRMGMRSSLYVVLQNLVSNGFGASVGLEAGYTQISSALASRMGLALRMRRTDLRTLVGCGAAAAIATAFNAPLTGAFYAFELIIGTYSIATLTPVVVAALAGTLTARSLVGGAFLVDAAALGPVTNADYAPALLLGVLCAGLAIVIMQGVTFVEAAARKSRIPAALRPAVGGAFVGGLALLSPQIMSSGHGALHLTLDGEAGAAALLLILLLKTLASAISIGSGFRGGLFFASLFMGCLIGRAFAILTPAVVPGAALTPAIYAIVGMSSLSVAVIGGPMTMTFMALELTGDFGITALVLAAVVASSLVVRKTFGYSFATWRFHLRGESIRGAHDIGWLRSFTVGRLMRNDVRSISDSMSLDMFRREFPLGSTQRVIVADDADRYAGIVLVPEAHAVAEEKETEPRRVSEILHHTSDMLLPQMSAREAAALFDRTEGEALAVVDNLETRKVVGLLTESHLLRRYTEELDRRRREAVGAA